MTGGKVTPGHRGGMYRMYKVVCDGPCDDTCPLSLFLPSWKVIHTNTANTQYISVPSKKLHHSPYCPTKSYRNLNILKSENLRPKYLPSPRGPWDSQSLGEVGDLQPESGEVFIGAAAWCELPVMHHMSRVKLQAPMWFYTFLTRIYADLHNTLIYRCFGKNGINFASSPFHTKPYLCCVGSRESRTRGQGVLIGFLSQSPPVAGPATHQNGWSSMMLPSTPPATIYSFSMYFNVG